MFCIFRFCGLQAHESKHKVEDFPPDTVTCDHLKTNTDELLKTVQEMSGKESELSEEFKNLVGKSFQFSLEKRMLNQILQKITAFLHVVKPLILICRL